MRPPQGLRRRGWIGVGLTSNGRVELAHQWAFAFALDSSLDCGMQFPGRAACAIGAVWVRVWVWVCAGGCGVDACARVMGAYAFGCGR